MAASTASTYSIGEGARLRIRPAAAVAGMKRRSQSDIPELHRFAQRRLVVWFVKMARGEMAARNLAQPRFLDPAAFECERTARMKRAARHGVDLARQLAGNDRGARL